MNAAVPRVADLVDATKADADPQADLAALGEAVNRLHADKVEALKALQAVVAERPTLALLDDDAGLDKADRREKAARRKIAHAEQAIPLLKARADAVREAATKAKAAPHVANARAARARVEQAALDFMDANRAAERVADAASADLGGAAAERHVPKVGFYGFPTPDGLANWRDALASLFGDKPPAPRPAGIVFCRVTDRPFMPYRMGDLISLPEGQARAAQAEGKVVFEEPEVVAAVQDPRRAPMPEPVVIAGTPRVTVLFLRPHSIGHNHPDAGGYMAGDLVTLQDLGNAKALVRQGYAQWVPAPAKGASDAG